MGTRTQSFFIGAGFLAVLVGSALAATQTQSQPQRDLQQQHKIVLPDRMTWGPPPPGLPSGAQASVVSGDPSRPGFYVVRIRAPEGYTIRPHWHTQDEHITVLSGRVEMGIGDELGKNITPGGPGAYFELPGGHHHSAVMRGETIVQIDGLGPFDIFYVNPSDDPRTKRSSR